MVVAVMDRLGLEERIQEQVKKENEEGMKRVMSKLLALQYSLKKEQKRVENLLNGKDVLVGQLQMKLSRLEEENKRLSRLAGLKESKTEQLKNGTNQGGPRIQLGSDSGCENFNSDNSSVSDESNEIIMDSCHESTKSSSPMPQSYSPTNTPVPKDFPSAGLTTNHIRGPKPPVASREAVNAKLQLNPSKQEYIVVTRDHPSSNTGLYVLDSGMTEAEPTKPADIITRTSVTSRVMAGVKGGGADPATVTPVHAMTNHRTGLKPSDVKHRARIKAGTQGEKTTVTYWTDTFL